MLIVSLARRVLGLEALAHFALSRADGAFRCVCLGCGAWDRDTVAPVSLLDGGEVDPDVDSGAYLCRECTSRLHEIREWVREDWPATLTTLEVERIWMLCGLEQEGQASQQAAREQSVASTLEDLQGARAALEQSGAHQGVDRFGKVACHG